MMKDLPQELVDSIIDYLHPSTSALLSCALVHPTWTAHSQKLLLSYVSLRPPLPSSSSPQPNNSSSSSTSTSKSKAAKLLWTLQSSPALTRHITHLALCEGSPLNSTTWLTTDRSVVPLLRLIASSSSAHSSPSSNHTPPSSDSNDPTTPNRHPKPQSHLRKVELTATYVHYWDLLPQTYISALLHMLKAASVECVRVHSWVFRDFKSLAGLVGCVRRGGTLSVSSVTICGGWSEERNEDEEDEGEEDEEYGEGERGEEHGEEDEEDGLQVLTLDFVTFPHMHEWLARSLPHPASPTRSHSLSTRSRPAGHLSLHSLRQLRIAQFQTHDPHVLQLILNHVPLLEYLHFKPGAWRAHAYDFSLNTRLHTLHMTLDDPQTAMTWAQTIVRSLPRSHTHISPPLALNSDASRTPLRSLTLEFYADPKKMYGWDVLDELIADAFGLGDFGLAGDELGFEEDGEGYGLGYSGGYGEVLGYGRGYECTCDREVEVEMEVGTEVEVGTEAEAEESEEAEEVEVAHAQDEEAEEEAQDSFSSPRISDDLDLVSSTLETLEIQAQTESEDATQDTAPTDMDNQSVYRTKVSTEVETCAGGETTVEDEAEDEAESKEGELVMLDTSAEVEVETELPLGAETETEVDSERKAERELVAELEAELLSELESTSAEESSWAEESVPTSELVSASAPLSTETETEPDSDSEEDEAMSASFISSSSSEGSEASTNPTTLPSSPCSSRRTSSFHPTLPNATHTQRCPLHHPTQCIPPTSTPLATRRTATRPSQLAPSGPPISISIGLFALPSSPDFARVKHEMPILSCASYPSSYSSSYSSSSSTLARGEPIGRWFQVGVRRKSGGSSAGGGQTHGQVIPGLVGGGGGGVGRCAGGGSGGWRGSWYD